MAHNPVPSFQVHTFLGLLQGFPADFVAIVGESAVRLIISVGVRLSVVFVMKAGPILFLR